MRGPGGPRRGLALHDLGIIPDGAVMMFDGSIHALGTDRQILNLARARHCDEIDATGRVVMPAFIDPIVSLAHARPSARSNDRLFRAYGNPGAELFHEALRDGSRALEGLSSQTLKPRAAHLAAGMLRHGTALAESRAPYGDLDDSALIKVLRIQSDPELPEHSLEIISSCLIPSPSPSEAASWADSVCGDLLPKIRRRHLARVIDLELNGRELPAPLAARILDHARSLGFTPKIHGAPFADTAAVSLAVANSLPCVQIGRGVNPDEIDMLADTPAVALFTPGIDLQTGMDGHAPGRAMVDRGAAPGLASAFHPELSPSYSMQMMIVLASRLYRWTAEEAITAATINSAYAVGAERSAGSLEAGKNADALILEVSDYRELAFHAGINVVDKVVKRGTVVYDSRSRDSLLLESNAGM